MAGIGETLRSNRERRGITVEQVAQDTRISLRFIEALEDEQFDELPAPVYVRGFLRSYANYLKIDPQPLLDQLVGGNRLPAGSPDGFVRGPGIGFATNGNTARRTDPFQRNVPPPIPAMPPRNIADEEPEDEQGWAPEGLKRSDHVAAAYIPGSDLIEAPEYAPRQEPIPVYRRTTGVLTERPPAQGDSTGGRMVMAAVVAVLAFVAIGALAVFALGGGDDGTNQLVGGDDTPTVEVSPTSVVAVGDATATAEGTAEATPGGSATPDPDATETVTATTTAGTPTATATRGSPTPTATPTTASTPTAAPTATPTQVPPTPTPTFAPPPKPSGLSACDLNKELEKCGPSPARIICFPPFPADQGTGFNSNWFVDVGGSYPLQPGWRERFVPYTVSIGPLIETGQYGCQ